MGAGSNAGPHFFCVMREPGWMPPPVEPFRSIIDANYGCEANVLSPLQCRRGAIRMRSKHFILGFLAGALAASGALAEVPKRIGPDTSPISTSVSVPAGSRLVY